MILALLVVTGIASHDETGAVAKKDLLRHEKEKVAEVPESIHRPD